LTTEAVIQAPFWWWCDRKLLQPVAYPPKKYKR
jgi:hypothetical protein